MFFAWFSDLLAGTRALRRDWRSGELRLLTLALIVAVAAVTSVGFLTDRVGRALERNSAQMLGGDLALQADEPIPAEFVRYALALGLDATQTQQFPSMVSSGTQTQLASLKAVSPGYPLRGALRVSETAADPGASTHLVPSSGTVWVDPRVLGLLGLKLGDSLALGDIRVVIAKVLTYEPDRGMQFVNVAPRVMMNLDDLLRTGLVAPGSRIRYELLLAGRDRAVQTYRTWLTPRLKRGQELRTLDSTRPEVQQALERAHQFLMLVALLAVMIASVAVALAARRFNLRHQDGVAIMRCLGATKSQLNRLLWMEFLSLAVVSALMGTAIGYGMQQGVASVLAPWIHTVLPAPSWGPARQGLATGLLLLFGFILPPLLALRDVAPVHVLRRGAPAGFSRRGWPSYVAGLCAFFALALWISDDIRLSAVVVGGFLLAALLFALCAYGAVRAMGLFRHRLNSHPTMRFVLAGIAQRKGLTVTQVCALAVGLMILLLLAITRTGLLAGWQGTLSPDTPNTFLINIQPEQRAALHDRLQRARIGSAAFSPMVRGRLVAINQKAVSGDSYADGRAKRLADREFNLSHTRVLPDSNQIIEGRWLDPARNEVSIESGLAHTLGIKLGDQLGFDVAGRAVSVAVTSVRDVKWDSFQVNFFALLTDRALKAAPTTYITSFHLPATKSGLTQKLVHEFPNLTVFDVGSILGQLQRVLDQVIQAVQLLFLFAVFAGVLVLAAAFFSTRDERMHEVAVLRALGASARQLSAALRVELILIGALAGVLAAAGAQLLAWALADRVFDFPLAFSWWPWLAGMGAGATLALIGGLIALKGVLNTPPLVSLRDAV